MSSLITISLSLGWWQGAFVSSNVVRLIVVSISMSLPFWNAWVVASWMGGFVVVDELLILVDDLRILLIRMAVLDLADPLVATNLESSFLEAQRLNVAAKQISSFFRVF